MRNNKLTTAERQRLRKLQNNLTYGRGIFLSDWPELIDLRRRDLISKNEDPDQYDLESLHVKKKITIK